MEMKTMEMLFKEKNNINSIGYVRHRKILLITHTDLDGSGAAIVLKALLPTEHIDIIRVDNDKMSETIRDNIINNTKYSMIFICDLSCNEYDAKLIDESNKKDYVMLLDHHQTALHLNQYKWACVYSDCIADNYELKDNNLAKFNKLHTCGTSLLYAYLKYIGVANIFPLAFNKVNESYKKYNNIYTDSFCDNNPWSLKMYERLDKLVFYISVYDTWDWITIFNGDKQFKDLNNLFHIYGYELFEKDMIEYLYTVNRLYMFDFRDCFLLQQEEIRRDNYVNKAMESITEVTMDLKNLANEEGIWVYNMAVVYANDYINDIFEAMMNRYDNKNIDIFVIISGNKAHLRTTRDNINVGAMAQVYGGGGHPKAAGFSIPEDAMKYNIETIFNF